MVSSRKPIGWVDYDKVDDEPPLNDRSILVPLRRSDVPRSSFGIDETTEHEEVVFVELCENELFTGIFVRLGLGDYCHLATRNIKLCVYCLRFWSYE